MDENVEGALSGIPPHALSVHLARSTIKMRHAATWRVDKSNQVHDLIVCLTGSGEYLLDGETITLSPGHAMLVPAGARFIGRHAAGERYTGVAQHFTLELFGNVDIISQMSLRRSVALSQWEALGPLIQHYHDTAPATQTTLVQHNMFMVILLHYIEDAFLGWRDQSVGAMAGQDALSLHIMLCAARIARDPLGADVLGEALSQAPYNADYFRRAFRDRIGYTPQKFHEFKKMEKAVHILALGRSVKQTAAEVGYKDAYFFSRMFKRYMGNSPSSYRLKRRHAATGAPEFTE